MARHASLLIVTTFIVVFAAAAVTADPYLENLQPDQKVNGFTALNVYENGQGDAMGARFISDTHGFIIDVMRIQSVPQAFWWVKTVPTSSKGEPHACEHLLLGKGNRGRYTAVLEDVSLGSSSAYTSQLRTCYHFNTTAGEDVFYKLFEAKLMAFLHPDFTDEEIRREVCHLGVVADAESGKLAIEEKGSVYTEMVSSFEKPWYHTWGALNKMVYGAEHPLAYNSGGDPEVMRDMTVDDMWKFIKETHHLSNMGVIAAIPNEIPVDEFLARMNEILVRCQDWEDSSEEVGIDAFQLPPSQGAEVGSSQIVGYPSEKADDQGYLLYAWPNSLQLESQDQFMLELFLNGFASGQTSNLYKLFIDSESRRLDIGGNYVYGGVDTDLGVSVYLGLVGVNYQQVNQTMLDSVANMIQAEMEQIRGFADGSDELKDFNQLLLSLLVQERKQVDDYLNSPPMFGFRSGVGSGWLSMLVDLEKEPGFRKSLTMKERFETAQAQLEGNTNVWKDYLSSWQLTGIKPYQVGAVPDTSMLGKLAVAKEKRIDQYEADFRSQYDTDETQVALAKYKEEFDANTVALEAVKSQQELPKFLDNPPLTLDEQLDYQTIAMASDIPMVASTFENMMSSTIGLYLRLDVIPESLLVYVPFLGDALTDIGATKDGEVLAYDDMRQRLRQEVLGLYAGFDHGLNTERVELSLTGEAANASELQAVVDWMDAVLFSSYLSLDNLARIQDVIDQALASTRNRMKGSEESWVDYPARGYRFQTNPLMLSTGCFLTQTHHLQRLRWRMTDPGDAVAQEEITMLFDLLGEYGQFLDREKLVDVLERLETIDQVVDDSLVATLPPPAQTLSETAKTNVALAAKELKASLNDIPDANLAADWEYLCRETKTDLLVQPSQALAELQAVLDLVRHADNARMYMVSNSSDRISAMSGLNDLLGKLDNGSSQRQEYGDRKRIVERMQSREPNVTDPVYVGLVHEGTRNGVLLFSAAHAGDYDTTRSAILDCLTGKLYSGGGPHGFFMQTWAAGLAYSNGYSYSPSSGRVSYYAERCPDVAQTMAYVVDIIKSAQDDPGLVDYAVALVFGFSRAPNRYEDRGRSMAADLTDGYTPEKIAAFRSKALQVAREDNIYDELRDRFETAYGPVFIGYGSNLADVPDRTFMLIGPEPQFENLEQYIATNEGAQPIHRLYPRDFWLTM